VHEGIGWFVLIVSFLWLTQTNQRNAMNQINSANHERRFMKRRESQANTGRSRVG
jgi:hypothetical protein